MIIHRSSGLNTFTGFKRHVANWPLTKQRPVRRPGSGRRVSPPQNPPPQPEASAHSARTASRHRRAPVAGLATRPISKRPERRHALGKQRFNHRLAGIGRRMPQHIRDVGGEQRKDDGAVAVIAPRAAASRIAFRTDPRRPPGTMHRRIDPRDLAGRDFLDALRSAWPDNVTRSYRPKSKRLRHITSRRPEYSLGREVAWSLSRRRTGLRHGRQCVEVEAGKPRAKIPAAQAKAAAKRMHLAVAIDDDKDPPVAKASASISRNAPSRSRATVPRHSNRRTVSFWSVRKRCFASSRARPRDAPLMIMGAPLSGRARASRPLASPQAGGARVTGRARR